jgi:hypothetical protein
VWVVVTREKHTGLLDMGFPADDRDVLGVLVGKQGQILADVGFSE